MKAFLSISIMIVFACLLFFSRTDAKEDLNIPTLGRTSLSGIPPEKEYKIGTLLLKELYAQAEILDDPILQDYTENLLYRLASVSELTDKRLRVILINNPTINAFAAPGGVVGINLGLFLHADNEKEIASVFAHELSHLSQRHFARRVEDQKNHRLSNLALLVGSILLTAKGGGEAGPAAIMSTMASSISHQLHFSRQQEEEADRIGIKTLFRADIDPRAMAEMFQKMQRLSPSSNFEFLQTHPLTINRISDALARASQFPKHQYKQDNTAFNLMKARARIHYEDTKQLIKSTKATIKNKKKQGLRYLAHYTLALAYMKIGKYVESEKYIKKLLAAHPNYLTYQLLQANFLFRSKQEKKALSYIRELYSENPDNFPVSMRYAYFLYQAEQYKKCQYVLRSLLEKRQQNAFIWERYKNAIGKDNKIETYYTANAQYLNASGQTQKAIEQIKYALNSMRLTYKQRQSMRQLLIKLQEDKKFAEKLTL